MKKLVWLILCSFVCETGNLNAEVIDLEDLNTFTGTNPAGGGSFYNGNHGTGTNSDGWTSRGAFFENSFDNSTFPNSEFWGGWSYSNVANTTSGGFQNEFASFAGGGSKIGGGIGGNYAVTYTGSTVDSAGNPLDSTYINLPSFSKLESIDISNTTYAALYARDGAGAFGDPALAKFGDGDFLRLTISGFDGNNGTGNSTGTFTYDLINYKDAGTADDFILADWLTADLSNFSLTKSLTFATTSSQISSFGGFFSSDAPAYVAIDNIVTAVPEPSSMVALAMAGLGGYYVRRRARRRTAV
jgi:hypothetical protein